MARKLTIAMLTFAVLVASAMPASAQTDVEKRLADLERRVKVLETVPQQTQPAPSNTRSAYKVTRLQPDDPMFANRPPELYEAQLIGFAPVAFRLRGFERVGEGDSAYSVLQKWHVEEP